MTAKQQYRFQRARGYYTHHAVNGQTLPDQRWAIKETDESPSVEYPIFHARLTAQLNPGNSATAVLVTQSPGGTGIFVDTANVVTVWDNYDRYSGTPGTGTPFGQNFGLIGEMVKARYNSNTEIFELVGSQGLLRRGLVDANTDAGNEATISLYNSAAAASCTGADTTVNLTACARRDVRGQDEVVIKWQPELKKWFIIANATGIDRQTYMGYPQSQHASGAIQTYNVWQVNPATAAESVVTGVTKSAYQKSGFAFLTDNLCYLVRIDATDGSELYLANVHPYEDCEIGDEAGFGPAVPLTVASDAITVTGSHHTLIPEGGPGSGLDIVKTINGGVDGKSVIFHRDGPDNIRFETGTGNIFLAAGDFTLNSVFDQIVFVYLANQATWVRQTFAA